MKVILGIVAAIVVLVVAFVGYQYWALQRAAVQWDSAEEIMAESIEQVDRTWKVHFESVIDKPLDQVWQAVQQPERSSEFITNFKKSELKKHEGNKKVIETQVQVLTLPLQTAVMEYTFNEPAKQVELKTLQSATQDLSATLKLEPSPDGKKTLLSYDASATPKVNIPLPVSAQKGAMRELFVKTVQAIKKGIESEEARRKAAA
jgi:carbon monoxide dehydrogenase subunit G